MTKNAGVWVIVIILIGLGIYFFSQDFSNLFSTKELTTTPTWTFTYGCEGDGNDRECFSGNYKIGDLILSAPQPSYNRNNPDCRFNDDSSTFGNMPDYCWSANFTFEDTKFSSLPNEWIKINNYIEVKWEPTARIYNGEVCHPRWETDSEGNKERIEDECKLVEYDYDWEDPEWKNKFTFRIYDTSFMSIDITDKKLAEQILDESFVVYEIFNDLTTIKGGSIIRETHKLWSPANTQKTETYTIYKGTRNYKTEISTETLGDKSIFINPFIIVQSINMGSSSPVILYSTSDTKELRILPNIENIPQQDLDFWNRNKPVESDIDESDELNKPIDTDRLIFFLFIFLIIAGVIAYANKQS